MSEHLSWKHTKQSFLEDELVRTFPEMVDLCTCSVTQSCPALCDPMECSPPGSSVHGISRQEYWMGCHDLLHGIFSTQGSNLCLLCLLHWQVDSLPLNYLQSPYTYKCVLSCFSCIRLFATLWTVAHQAPLSMGFSRQEYWSGLPCPPPRHLPNPGIKPASPVSPAWTGRFFTTEAPGKPINICRYT